MNRVFQLNVTSMFCSRLMVLLCGPCACSTAPWSHSTSTWPRETLWCATAPKMKLQRPKSLCTCKPSASFHFLFLFFKVMHQPQWTQLHWSWFFFLLMCLGVSKSYFCLWVVTWIQRWQSCPRVVILHKIWWPSDFCFFFCFFQIFFW